MHQMCHLHCNVRGAFYMATQYGSECWCTREQDLDYASLDFGVCDTRCSGDEVRHFFFFCVRPRCRQLLAAPLPLVLRTSLVPPIDPK